MPVSFRRLRISGFKSFAEPTSVEILPGLTGIVGPNGCGKSNVVEALRWAMGESSARNLRGGEMEDVIFAGTAGRASRNIAEVTLFLDEADGPRAAAVPRTGRNWKSSAGSSAAADRPTGSMAGKPGRATCRRCLPTWLPDRVPRRWSARAASERWSAPSRKTAAAVLEEAANITGLHARRHEAELKLRAAEANLSRAEDLRAQLESQLGNLKRQARQASRYRNISGAIRAAEAELLALQRARVEQIRAQAAAALHEAEAGGGSRDRGSDGWRRRTQPRRPRPCRRCGKPKPTRAPCWNAIACRRNRLPARSSRRRLPWPTRSGASPNFGRIWRTPNSCSATRRSADQRLATEEAALAEADAGHDERVGSGRSRL